MVIQNGQLYQVAREPLSKTGWTLRGLGAAITSVSAVDSASAWVNFTGTSGYQEISAGYWSPVVTPPSGRDLDTPTVGSDGTIWALDVLYDELLKLDLSDPANPQWLVGAPNPAAADLLSSPAGTLSNLWMLADAGLWNFNGTSWKSVSTGSYQLAEVLVGPDGLPWLLTSDGLLLSSTPNQWTELPTNLPGSQNVPGPVSSAASAGSGVVWAIITPTGSSSPALYMLTLTPEGILFNFTCEQVTGPFDLTSGQSTLQVSCGGVDGTLWLSDSTGTLWKYLPGADFTWQRQIEPPGLPSIYVGGGITEVVVIANNGSSSAFFVQDDNLYMCNLAEGSWQEAQGVLNSKGSPISCSGLTVAQDDQGVMFAHAADTEEEGLVVVNVSAGVASANVYSSKVPLAGNSVQVSASSAQWIVLVAAAGELFVSLGNSTNPTKSFNQVKVSGMPQSIQSLVPAARSNPYYALALDSDGAVWWISGLDPQNNKINLTFQQLTGGSTNSLIGPVTAISSTLPGRSSPIEVFAVSNQQLWLMRSTTPTYGSGWTTFHPMGDPVSFVGAGVGTARMSDLGYLDSDSFLNRLWQDPVSGKWIAQPVLQPDIAEAEPTYLSQYITQLTVFNNNPNLPQGVPAAGVPVVVGTVEPVSVWSTTPSTTSMTGSQRPLPLTPSAASRSPP